MIKLNFVKWDVSYRWSSLHCCLWNSARLDASNFIGSSADAVSTSFDSVKDTPMKADKKDPEKDRRIGRILMFITF